MYPISQIKMAYFNFFFFSPYICAWIIQIQRSLFSAGGKLFGTCVFYCMARSVIFSTSIQTKAFTVRCIIIKKPKKAIYVLELQQGPQKSKKKSNFREALKNISKNVDFRSCGNNATSTGTKYVYYCTF